MISINLILTNLLFYWENFCIIFLVVDIVLDNLY